MGKTKPGMSSLTEEKVREWARLEFLEIIDEYGIITFDHDEQKYIVVLDENIFELKNNSPSSD